MKKSPLAILAVLATLYFSGCGPEADRNEIIIFRQTANDQYASIIWAEREYVPYCAISPTKRGAYLGHMEDDEDVKIYELDGYPNDEWIIDYLNGEAMLWKEINVQDIPDGFYSEYEWNHVAEYADES